MTFRHQTLTFPSSDGKHNLNAEIYEPNDGKPVGVVQLSHGMADYVGRYRELAEFLTQNGYIFAGHCHLGHGKGVLDKSELGFFAKRGGDKLVISDLGKMNAILHARYPDLPVYLLGHSMGSFIARIYTARHPDTVKGLIIHGTGGPKRALVFGKALVAALSLFCGKKHRSPFVKSLTSKGYNSKFPKEEGENAWLTRDGKIAGAKALDEYANFPFTLAGYADLFRFVGKSNSKKWFNSYPKNLPTLIISGDMDPVGGFGEGVKDVYQRLIDGGNLCLTFKLYEGARHELFNEINRQEVFSDILTWLRRI